MEKVCVALRIASWVVIIGPVLVDMQRTSNTSRIRDMPADELVSEFDTDSSMHQVQINPGGYAGWIARNRELMKYKG